MERNTRTKGVFYAVQHLTEAEARVEKIICSWSGWMCCVLDAFLCWSPLLQESWVVSSWLAANGAIFS